MAPSAELALIISYLTMADIQFLPNSTCGMYRKKKKKKTLLCIPLHCFPKNGEVQEHV